MICQVNGARKTYQYEQERTSKPLCPELARYCQPMIILLRTLFLLRSTRNQRGHG